MIGWVALPNHLLFVGTASSVLAFWVGINIDRSDKVKVDRSYRGHYGIWALLVRLF